MPRVSQQYKDDQRAQIVAAARRCFVRNGFHRTSMQDVFAEAGRSAGAVYRYFAKKDDMILAVADQNLTEVAGILRGVLADDDGSRSVGEVFAALLDAVAAEHADTQLAAIALTVWSESLRNPALAERLKESIKDMSEELAELARQRPEAGASADALAKVILSILPGFLLNLALLGPEGVAGFSDTVRTLF